MNNSSKKFSASYNVFSDCTSLLEASIKSVRESINFISITYSEFSNIGQPASEDLVPLLNELKNKGLVDKLIKYTPSINQTPHQSELAKRNLGLILAEENNCNYHISLDSDEFYLKEDLEKVKQLYIDDDLDVIYAPLKTFYKDFEHMYLDNYYVSLFYKMSKGKQYKLAQPSPVTIDPTRSSGYNKFLVADRDLINLYHGSYIRTNEEIIRKFENSSARVNFNDEIKSLIDYFYNWKDGEKGFIAGRPSRLVELTKVENKFKELF